MGVFESRINAVFIFIYTARLCPPKSLHQFIILRTRYKCPSLYSHQHRRYLTFNLFQPDGGKQYFTIVFIYVALIIYEVKHLFLCISWPRVVVFLVNCAFMAFIHFSIYLFYLSFFFIYWFVRDLYILSKSPLWVRCIEDVFLNCFSTVFIVFPCQNFFHFVCSQIYQTFSFCFLGFTSSLERSFPLQDCV